MAPEAVTTFADRWAVEIIVCAMTKFRMGTITATERGQLGSLLSRFGLTPADRSRVVATLAPNEEDDWDDLDTPT